MATAFVQGKHGVAFSTVLTINFTVTGNIVAGNLVALYFHWSNAATNSIVSVVDNLGNTYTQVDLSGFPTDGRGKAATYYAKNVAGGNCTITITLASTDLIRGFAHEISGASTSAPLDGHAIQIQSLPGSGTDAVSSTAATTIANGCYIFAGTNHTSSDTLTVSTGFTKRISDDAIYISADKIQSPAGSIAATFTTSGGTDFITAMMAFKPTGTGFPIAAATGSLNVAGPSVLFRIGTTTWLRYRK